MAPERSLFTMANGEGATVIEAMTWHYTCPQCGRASRCEWSERGVRRRCRATGEWYTPPTPAEQRDARVDTHRWPVAMELAAAQEIEVAARRLVFLDRVVTFLRGTTAQLAVSLDVLGDVAEVRKARETTVASIDVAHDDRGEWGEELRSRLAPPPPDAPAVCVLDTRVTRGHPLLETSLDEGDCQSCDPAWGTRDHYGHGTEMVGLALDGDLAPLLAGSGQVTVRHRLESEMILPLDGHLPKSAPEREQRKCAARSAIRCSFR